MGQDASTRNSRKRQAIEKALAGAGRPLSPGELLTAASSGAPGLGIATVYRALRLGLDQGTIHAVEVSGTATRYESAHHGHHHHFRCTACDRVFEVHACPGDLAHLAPPGFQVTGHEITLLGRCAVCSTGG